MAEAMNPTEGLMRIAKVVRWLGYLFGAVTAIFGAFTAFTGGNDAPVVGAMVVGLGVAFAVAGWMLAWIVEGFAKPKS